MAIKTSKGKNIYKSKRAVYKPLLLQTFKSKTEIKKQTEIKLTVRYQNIVCDVYVCAHACMYMNVAI